MVTWRQEKMLSFCFTQLFRLEKDRSEEGKIWSIWAEETDRCNSWEERERNKGESKRSNGKEAGNRGPSVRTAFQIYQQ